MKIPRLKKILLFLAAACILVSGLGLCIWKLKHSLRGDTAWALAGDIGDYAKQHRGLTPESWPEFVGWYNATHSKPVWDPVFLEKHAALAWNADVRDLNNNGQFIILKDSGLKKMEPALNLQLRTLLWRPGRQ